jgi:hypothetical protein
MSTAMRYATLSVQGGRVIKRHNQRPIWLNAVLFAILWLFLSLSLMIGMDRVLAKGEMSNFPMIFMSQEGVGGQVNYLKPMLSFCVWQFPGLCG